METNKKNYFKYAVGFIFCLFLRLIPFRAPNIETILAVQMPFSRVYGKFLAFSFGFFSIIFYDIITGTLGKQTLIVSLTYGFLGLWAVNYFQNKNNNSLTYVKFAVMSTLLFDFITGVMFGPIFFHQTFLSALSGQIPFTLFHLSGNIIFATILSPVIYQMILQKKKSEEKYFIKIPNPKTI